MKRAMTIKPRTEIAAEVRRLREATRETSGRFRDGFALGAKIALDWALCRQSLPSDVIEAMDSMARSSPGRGEGR